MNDFVVVIPCGFKKSKATTKAKHLYTGPYFKANLTWALSVTTPENVFILSALHGLIGLEHEVKPYNLKMGQPGSVSPTKLRQQGCILGFTDKQIIALGGKEYLKALSHGGFKFTAPVGTLPLGKTMQLLKTNRGVLPPWKKL